jgi:hypothetical protein
MQTRDHLFGVPRMEGPAEDHVGRGAEGDQEEEAPVHNPRPPCRLEVWPGGTRLPSAADVGRLVPAEEDAGSEVSEWELQSGGGGTTAVPPHTLFHGIHRR